MQARDREELQQDLLRGLRQLFPNSLDEFWKITGQGTHSDWEHLSTAREAHATAVWGASNGAESRDQIVLSWIIGDLHFSRGNLSRAAEIRQQALESVKRLADREPDNAGWQRDVSVSLGKMGDVLLEQGNLEGARRAYEQAMEIAKQLAEREPGHVGWQTDLVVSQSRVAGMLVHGSNSDRVEAIRLLTLAWDTLRRLAADSRLTHAQQQWLPAIENALQRLEVKNS